MDYPLNLTFKLLTIGTRLSVTDAGDRLLFFVRQKKFRLREHVVVFADREQRQPVADIKADRVLDISATYHFEDPQGRRFGGVRRSGVKSLWRAHYDVLTTDGGLLFTIREDSAVVRFLDGMLYQIPVLGMLSGYLLHPSYTVARPDGTAVLSLTKRPAMWEGRFRVDRVGDISPDHEALAMLSILMMVLLERARG